ncbi:MAG: [FeFe] hydrogenase H-cluster maturation GTPase HydF [Bacteroidota bacterium]|nr:[FeFe] hydrogenase H-cluster maturation GTPase HydF [Bacteroidota bacterium]
MQPTPKGLRLHIGIFGRRNVGKSSVLNALTRQNISIVSEVAGTTTDPVEKAMEFRPLGPVLFVDTAGIDDVGALGEERVARTKDVIDRVDLAVLVTDAWQTYEEELLALFRSRRVPIVAAANKADLRIGDDLEKRLAEAGASRVVRVCAVTGEGIEDLREGIIACVPESFIHAQPIVADLIRPGEYVILVVPVDIAAPKGRLILPQVQTLREVLDADASALVVKERDVAQALSRLHHPPALVITDSQAFRTVSEQVPRDVPLTSFSILFTRFKGDLETAVDGARHIDGLKPGDRVLIAEACTHHPTSEDIGRVKIPRWLEERVKGPLDIRVSAGADFPDDLSSFSLVIHCGACVFNRRHMLSRIERCRHAGVPITNYGLAIAYLTGIFDRALEPLMQRREIVPSKADNA